jgi:hypothetical protein
MTMLDLLLFTIAVLLIAAVTFALWSERQARQRDKRLYADSAKVLEDMAAQEWRRAEYFRKVCVESFVEAQSLRHRLRHAEEVLGRRIFGPRYTPPVENPHADMVDGIRAVRSTSE